MTLTCGLNCDLIYVLSSRVASHSDLIGCYTPATLRSSSIVYFLSDLRVHSCIVLPGRISFDPAPMFCALLSPPSLLVTSSSRPPCSAFRSFDISAVFASHAMLYVPVLALRPPSRLAPFANDSGRLLGFGAYPIGAAVCFSVAIFSLPLLIVGSGECFCMHWQGTCR